jgi:hypothetical protein
LNDDEDVPMNSSATSSDRDIFNFSFEGEEFNMDVDLNISGGSDLNNVGGAFSFDFGGNGDQEMSTAAEGNNMDFSSFF